MRRYNLLRMAKLLRILRLATTVARLGADRRAAAKLFLLVLAMPVKRRVPALRERWVELRLRVLGTRLKCVVSDGSELETLKDVFVDEDYRLPPGPPPAVIVDLGSLVGFSILYFALRYPRARIHGFEPHPRTFAKLRANTAGLARVHVDDVAVTGRDGASELFDGEGSWSASLVRSAAAGEAHTVRGRRLDAILDELGVDTVDLLKIDVEGAELDVLESFAGLHTVRTVVGEVHEDLIRGSLDDVVAALGGFRVTLEEDVPGRYHLRAQREGMA